MSANTYKRRDISKLGNHYIKHVDAMTKEGLHSKTDIAAELAFRDMIIEKNKSENSEGIEELITLGLELTRKIETLLYDVDKKIGGNL